MMMSSTDTTKDTTVDMKNDNNIKSFQITCLILGFLIGFFIYLSTLGAEFVGIILWGRSLLTKTQFQLLIFSLVWNTMTTTLAVLVMYMLRTLITSTTTILLLSTTRSTLDDDEEEAEEEEDDDNDENEENNINNNNELFLQELLIIMESRFAIGALIGICIAWNISNVILGMKPQIISSCFILFIACLWCHCTFHYFGITTTTSTTPTTTTSTTTNEDKEEVEKDTMDNLKTPLIVQIV